MKQLLTALRASYPHLKFTPGSAFVWSPETQEVFYKAQIGSNSDQGSKIKDQRHAWSLLHETGHALLEHASYQADIELLKMEVAAWNKARELAQKLEIAIDEDHIQDCLDTYRDWLYRRSICPTCTSKCLQQSDYQHYRCYNCHTVWKVTPSRFARPYRSVRNINATAVFHSEVTL